MIDTAGCHNVPMCGRYKLSRRKQVVEEYFDCGSDEPDWSPRYNIAPTQPIPVIRQNSREPIRGLIGRCPDDQRKIGNSEHQACVS
jgi:putative SOS response-associated peptidase YedK